MKRLVDYYGCTNAVLWFQAILFILVGGIWSIDDSSVDIDKILEEVNYLKPDTDESECEENLLTNAIGTFDSYLNSRSPLPSWKRYGSKYALVLFSFAKISFTTISFLQLYFLDRFIGDHSKLFGLEVLSKMWHGESLSIFPPVVICKFSTSRDNISYKHYSVC